MNQKLYLNSKELAEHFRVTPRTVANWRKERKIPFIKRNARSILYDLEEVDRQLRQGFPSEGTGHYPALH